MYFLPSFPFELNTITLFGITLLLGLIGGQLARRVRYLPQISGYIAIGFMLGPAGFNVINYSLLTTTRIFVDISLGLILFDIGRHLDFTWLRYDRGLLPTALAESGLTFLLVFLVCRLLIGLGWLPSALAASFAMASSPAVMLMVTHDLASEGPITRRVLMLTSINNFFALLVFTLLLPFTRLASLHSLEYWEQCGYHIIGSLVISVAVFMLARLMAMIIGKSKESQFVLFIGVLIFTIGMTQSLKLPTALSLFFLGVATRNLDFKHALMEIEFGWSTRLFFILLFVVTGMHLRLDGLKMVPLGVIAFILVRGLAKYVGIMLFAKKSQITKQQIIAISLALTPMAGLAISMSYVLNDFNPDINRKISAIIAAVVAILEIFGPIATQLAFIWTKETSTDRIT